MKRAVFFYEFRSEALFLVPNVPGCVFLCEGIAAVNGCVADSEALTASICDAIANSTCIAGIKYVFFIRTELFYR